MVSVCAPVADEQRHEIAGLGAALLHLREQHRRDRRHVGRLGAGDAGDQIHRADQHVMQAAADMAEQARQEARPWPAPCRSSRSGARGTRTAAPTSRMRCDMPSSIRPTTHHERRARGQRQIAEGREAEREGDRHAGEHAEAATTPTKKITQVEVAERPQTAARPARTAADDDGDRYRSASAMAGVGRARSSRSSANSSISADADRQRRGAPACSGSPAPAW